MGGEGGALTGMCAVQKLTSRYSLFSLPRLLSSSSSSLLSFFLFAGKVHGSLARAGKVRGQTPKVAKNTDKKKLPKGRAMKRLKYTRRFVNVGTSL